MPAAQLLATLTSYLPKRLRDRDDSQRGAISLEYVVIGLGLFLIAGVIVGVVTGAINVRLAGIN